jgi:nitroreductase
MAIQALLLAAVTLGLGGCCLGGPLMAPEEVEPLLGLGPREQISLVAALGHPKI